MRVLVVHNRYQSTMPSGENTVVDDDIRMMRETGLEVQAFFRDSDTVADAGPLRMAARAGSPTYSLEAVREFRRVLRAFTPDIVHLHNPFPLISPWVIRVAMQMGIPIVQTVHNYRHSCPGSMGFFRDGRICEDCIGKSLPWPSVVHACYRDSRAQSLSMALATRVHRSTWQHVDRFLAVSDFVAHHLILAGVLPDKIVVRPNCARSCGPASPPGKGFIFVGRLTAEKGVSLLMSAWALTNLHETQQLVVVGDGPERDAVLGARESSVRYEGQVDSNRVRKLLDEAAIVVIPSLCYEGFPRLVAEAFERGRPVASTALGSLRELVSSDVGWTTEPNPDAFATMLSRAIADPTLPTKATAARSAFEARFTPELSLQRLLSVYSEVASGTARPSDSHRIVNGR